MANLKARDLAEILDFSPRAVEAAFIVVFRTGADELRAETARGRLRRIAHPMIVANRAGMATAGVTGYGTRTRKVSASPSMISAGHSVVG